MLVCAVKFDLEAKLPAIREELEKRRANHKPKQKTSPYSVLRRYAQQVGSAASGARYQENQGN